MTKATVSTTVRANARLLSAGFKTIDEVLPQEIRVDVYVYAIGTYGYTLEQVDVRYLQQVKDALGIVD